MIHAVDLHAKGALKRDEDFQHKDVLAIIFTGKRVRETRVGSRPALVPTIRGEAWNTWFAPYAIDPADPFPEGYIVGESRRDAMGEPFRH